MGYKHVKQKEKSVSQLKKIADKYWSIATRYRFADNNGMVSCVTCGVTKPLKELQCGHFMSRRFNATRFSELNTAPQCVACNMFRSGEQYKFSLFLDDYYGKGTAEQLQKEAQQIHKLTKQELLDIIHDAKEQVRYYEERQ